MIKILYVEDHPPARLLMNAIIEDLTEYQLVTAATGAAAQALMAEQRPDLYILDLDLPDIDGVTLAKSLCKINNVPIILVSAYAEVVQTEDLDTLMHYYLAKPLDPMNVAQTIKRALA